MLECSVWDFTYTNDQISDVVNQLFSHLPPTRVTSFSCGHIIPATNLQALVVCKGPRGGDLEYKAAQQGDPAVVSGPAKDRDN